MTIVAFDPKGLDVAAASLERGELVVIPTDTVYGIAARIDRPRALERLIEVKRRPKDLPIPVLVAGFDEAQSIGIFDEHASRLARAWWPGPLTIVVGRAPGFDVELGGDGATVGLRVPDHLVALALLERSGALATSSANVSGETTPAGIRLIAEIFGDEVSVYVEGNPPPGGVASTVVAVQNGTLHVIREGDLTMAQVRAAMES